MAKLAALTNEDKHKVMLIGAVSGAKTNVGPYEGIDCRIDSPNVFIQLELKNGAKWAEFQVTPTGPEPKVKMNDSIESSIIRLGSIRCPIGEFPEIRATVIAIIDEFTLVF